MGKPDGNLAEAGGEEEEFDLSSLGEEIEETQEEHGFRVGEDGPEMVYGDEDLEGLSKPVQDIRSEYNELLVGKDQVDAESIMGWIAEAEVEARAALSEKVRRQIAETLAVSKDPIEGLIHLKNDIRVDEERKTKDVNTYAPTALVINKVIERLIRIDTESIEESSKPKNLTGFQKQISDSLERTLLDAEMLGTENYDEMQAAADRINEIFESVHEDISSGNIRFNFAELQNEIDWYVEKYTFDRALLEDSMNKYLDLSKIGSLNDEDSYEEPPKE